MAAGTVAEDTSNSKLGAVKRLLIYLAALLTAFHLFATFLWIAPASVLRQVVPGDLLEQYMIPMFGQSWSVFAPEPINGDYYFDLRAVVSQDGQEITTEWIRVTDVEQDHAMYNLFPPRSANLGVGVASTLKNSWDGLPDPEKAVIELNYYEGDDFAQRLEDGVRGLEADASDIDEYLEAEHIATAYGTQVALAVWGDDVVRIQYQVARQNVVPFAQRNAPHAERPALQRVPTGWRGLIIEPAQDQDAFRDYFCNTDVLTCKASDDE